MQAEEAEDDTGRLSELIALAEAGLQAKKDDNAFFTQAVEAADEAEAAYYRRQTDQGNAGEQPHEPDGGGRVLDSGRMSLAT